MSRERVVRIFLLLLLVGSLVVGGRVIGAHEWLTQQNVQAWVQQWGPWGVVLFVAFFCLGELIHVPGIVFVGAAVFAYGPVWGYILSLLAGVSSVSVSFLLVRTVGGKVFTETDRPFIKRMMGQLETRPIRTVALIRVLFFLSPWINYVLGVTGLSFRHYFLGSIAGLTLPMLAATVLFYLIL